MTTLIPRLCCPLIAASACLQSGASEISYNCTVLPATSSVVQSNDVTSPFSGTFIGNYDATTNPTGTLTIPGLFGGSGNSAISYTASFALAGDINSHPSGTLTAGIDASTLQIRISALALDLLGGVPGTLAATLNINYQSFHTQQPTAIYPGGVNIPIPVGNGSVTTLQAVQTGPAVPGILVPQKNGSFNFTAAVPVNIIAVATLMGQSVLDGTPQPGVLPLSGNVMATASGVVMSITIADQTSTTQPVTNGAFTDQPLAIPTVIPAGNTANVLMSGTITSVTVASTLNANLAINGTRAPILGDLNGDFSVNSVDLAICLGNWGGAGIGDCDGDGVVDSRDIAVILNNWQ